ncbi:MAG: HlyC/CorC family transporter [Chloroflexi bacterium]|nr:MAG: HlyC/CorC family transporter [Chloroflexota bacterium]
MSGFIWVEIIIVFALIIANAFFAASEIAIVSARRSRLQQDADHGRKSAKQALELAEHPDRFLATVQVGISLISTLAAAFGGASISEPLAQWIRTFPILAPYANTLALGSVVILITYFSLVLGELAPKRLALQSAERIANAAAPFMLTLSRIARPVVAFLTFSADTVLRLLGQKRAHKLEVTEEDIVYLAREGAVSGNVETTEEEFINRVFRFTDRTVSSVMTPRSEIVAIEVGTPFAAVIETFLTSGYTRLPLYEGVLDNIIGVLYAKDLLRAHIEDNIDLVKVARPPFFIPEYQHVDDLLTTFRRRGIHMAIVTDEYSQMAGLVTLEDVLEELVGEIQDEYDTPEDKEPFVQREDGSWLVDAMTDREAVRDKIGLTPEVEHADYNTLAGMLLAHMGRIPSIGETISIGDFVLEIVDMDGRRIDKVLIRPTNKTEGLS